LDISKHIKYEEFLDEFLDILGVFGSRPRTSFLHRKIPQKNVQIYPKRPPELKEPQNLFRKIWVYLDILIFGAATANICSNDGQYETRQKSKLILINVTEVQKHFNIHLNSPMEYVEKKGKTKEKKAKESKEKVKKKRKKRKQKKKNKL